MLAPELMVNIAVMAVKVVEVESLWLLVLGVAVIKSAISLQ